MDPVSQTVKNLTDMHVKLMQQMLSLSLYLSFTLSAPTHVDKKRNPPTDTLYLVRLRVFRVNACFSFMSRSKDAYFPAHGQ